VRSTSPSPLPTRPPQEAAGKLTWQRPLQQLRPRVPPATTTSPAATMRNSQPRPHPTLRLLPQERGGGDVLDPIGRDALGRLRAIDSQSGPVTTSDGFAFRHGPPRHHLRPQTRRWRQNPVVGHQVLPRLRHQRAQPLHQHLLRHHHRRRPVPPTLLQRIPDPAIAPLHQPRLRHRRTRRVTTQLLQLLAIARRNPRARVQREPVHSST
jgi:hypothetical protein